MLWTALEETVSGVGDWRTWAPVASVVVALLALLVGVSNRRMARQALVLSLQQEERRAARLDVSLKEGISFRSAAGERRWIGLRVLAVNPTDRDGTLVTVDLHVTYTTATGTRVVLKVPHGAGPDGPPTGITELEIPARLPANSAVEGWLVFRLDDATLGGGAVERYDAVLRDSRGPVEALHMRILREVVDDQAN